MKIFSFIIKTNRQVLIYQDCTNEDISTIATHLSLRGKHVITIFQIVNLIKIGLKNYAIFRFKIKKLLKKNNASD